VERLTHEKISDPKFRKAFLLTYRSFTTPLQLIEALLIRYGDGFQLNFLPIMLSFRYDPTSLMKTEEITTKRVRVVGVIKAWMEDHFYDFNEPEVQQALTSFFDSMVLTMENSAKQLRRVFEKAKERNMV
jgi:son of sevenless-like protein